MLFFILFLQRIGVVLSQIVPKDNKHYIVFLLSISYVYSKKKLNSFVINLAKITWTKTNVGNLCWHSIYEPSHSLPKNYITKHSTRLLAFLSTWCSKPCFTWPIFTFANRAKGIYFLCVYFPILYKRWQNSFLGRGDTFPILSPGNQGSFHERYYTRMNCWKY